MGAILWRRLTPESGWFAFFVLVLLGLFAGYSTYRADWSDDLGIATRAVVAGILLAYLLAKPLGLPEWAAHPLGALSGTGVVLWLMQALLSDHIGDWRAKLTFLWSRWVRWYTAVREGERGDDIYHFLLLIALLHLLVGYISAWLLVRHNHAWVSALLPTVVVLVNAGYSRTVPIFLVTLTIGLDLLLVGRSAQVQLVRVWRQRGVPYASGIVWQSLWVLSWLAVVVLVVGWLIPLGTHSPRAAATLRPTAEPWQEVRDTLAQWFPSVRGPGVGRGSVGGFASFSDRFDIGGPLRLSDEPVLLLHGVNGVYLTVRTYDTYTGRGWRSSTVPDESPDTAPITPTTGRSEPVPLLEFASGEELPRDGSTIGEREEVTYRIEILQTRGASLAYTGHPIAFDVPVRVLYGWRDVREWRAIEVAAASEGEIPLELRPLVALAAGLEFRDPTATPGTLQPSIPACDQLYWSGLVDSPELQRLRELLAEANARGLEVLVEWEAGEGGTCRLGTVHYRGQLPDYEDLEAVYPTEGVRRGLSYEVVTEVSRATAEELRAVGSAGQDSPAHLETVVNAYGIAYPRDLYERYTQLSETVTARTRQLAFTLADGKTSVYDIAVTIEQFVRQRIAYNESVPVPGGIDAVDTVLFERPEGYCTFYASSMAVLLRVLGIPTRVVVGYYPGEFDSRLGGFVYRDRNAHAWVEVYFPGHGWIPFEPTASRPPLTRGTEANASDLLLLDPTFDWNLPDDERFGLLFPELGGREGAGAVGRIGAGEAQERTLPRVVLVGLAVLALALAGAMVWWTWGTWGLSPIARLFVRLRKLARLAGIRPHEAQTPLEFAWQVGRTIPGTRRSVTAIAELYSREQYGRRPVSREELRVVTRAWRESVRPRLLRAALRFRRGGDTGESRHDA